MSQDWPGCELVAGAVLAGVAWYGMRQSKTRPSGGSLDEAVEAPEISLTASRPGGSSPATPYSLAIAEVPLTRGLVAIVDLADLPAISSGRPWRAKVRSDRTPYAMRDVVHPDGRRTPQYMHTVLTGWNMVDHINGNGLDNRRANLRPANSAFNQANTPLRRTNTSGFRGVTFRPRERKWRAQIGLNGKFRHLGHYDTPEAAARAYDAAALAAWGEYARPNFPAPISSPIPGRGA